MTGPSFVMLLAVLATAVPALGVVLAGVLLDQPLLTWTGVAVGLLAGTASPSTVRAAGQVLHQVVGDLVESITEQRVGQVEVVVPVTWTLGADVGGVSASAGTASARVA